jgi:RHS repeat-associated protein/uncharacterized delta-60 repeat protein
MPTSQGYGRDVADVTTNTYDQYNRLTSTVDGDGYVTTYAYDDLTGAMTQMVQDSGGTGHLNLTNSYTVDALGRTTKEVDPNGNVTYTVYNDAAHQVRIYPGFQSSTGKTTGPVMVMTTVYPAANSNATSNTYAVYSETLSTYDAPHLTAGVPDGTETITAGNIASLSRDILNNSGQVVETDDYFRLNGLSYSTASNQLTGATSSNSSATGNYSATTFWYDDNGNQAKVVAPTGTITRTLYDNFRRVSSVWTGTDDTPTGGGFWSLTNMAGTNLVKTMDNVYDNGGSGDGDLTKTTEYPSGTTLTSTGLTSITNVRATQTYYDWRDRPVLVINGTLGTVSGTGHTRPISYYTYDNMDEVTETQGFDGDSVGTVSDGTGTFAGVPLAPSSSLLRSMSTSSYDDQGRVYESDVFSVDPVSGATSTSNYVGSYTWYDHRGEVMKTLSPGGLVEKFVYDGAGRNTITYQTDGAGDAAPGATNTWSNAAVVGSNNVLEQDESQYDANGNVILTATRERYANSTTTGVLAGPSGTGTYLGTSTTYTGAQARVYYEAYFYDAADRLTDTVNVGTNGGIAYSRPTSAPTGSTSSVLVNHTNYDIVMGTTGTYAGLFGTETINPAGTKSRTYVDLMGRTVWTIQGYMGVLQTSSTDVRTSYTYDGDGNVTSMTAHGDGRAQIVTLAGVSGTVDVQNGALIFRDTSVSTGTLLADVTAAVVAGLHGTTTATGLSIISSDTNALTGLAVVVNTNGAGGTLVSDVDGVPVLSTDVIVEYTYLGDTTLKGYVDATDLTNLLAGMSGGLTGWVNGDFNYDGVVNSTDEATLLTTLSGQGAPLHSGADATSQTTQYNYGVTTGTGTNGGSGVASNDLLSSTEYPDPTTGLPSTSQVEYTRYDALGETTYYTDRNGTTHQYAYDDLGRVTSDKVGSYNATSNTFSAGTLPTGIDSTVQQLTYSYDSAGNLGTLSSLGSGSTVVNTTTRTYNGYGQILTDNEPNGSVTYTYSTPSSSLSASRLTGMTYGQESLSYVYNSGVDSTISRLSGITTAALSGSGTVTAEGYTYLGLSTMVTRSNPEIGTSAGLTLVGTTNGPAGDIYSGLDTFGRVSDQKWLTGSGSTEDEYQYTYDLDSNPIAKVNVLSSSNSEAYAYDDLDRLISFARGSVTVTGTTIPTSSVTGTATASQTWNYDSMGNWQTVTLNGTTTVNAFNAQNQQTTNGTTGNALAYDADGNQTTDEKGDTLTYDAWNRMVGVSHGSTFYSAYAYDALGQRITTTAPKGAGGVDTSFGSSAGTFTGSGSVTHATTTSGAESRGLAEALDSSGDVVVAGYDANQAMVLVYNPNGTPDTSFNGTGQLLFSIGSTASARATGVAIQSNGDIVVVGQDTSSSGVTGTFVVRLTSAGAFDSTFGSSGVATATAAAYSPWSSGDRAETAGGVELVTVSGSQYIDVLVSVKETSTNKHSVVVLQFNSSGSLNTSYGSSGAFSYYSSDENPQGLAALSDGSLVISGTVGYDAASPTGTGYDPFILKVTPSGSLDTTFGTVVSGAHTGVTVLYTPQYDNFNGGLTVLPDGEIVIAGNRAVTGSTSDMLEIEFTSAGALDTSFGVGGYATQLFGVSASVWSITCQGDGRILVAGEELAYTGASPSGAVTRLNADGSVDATFGVFGVERYSLGFQDFQYAAAVWSGTTLFIAGAASSGSFFTDVDAMNLGGNVTTDYTFSTAGQILTQHDTTTGAGSYDYIWSPAYVNAMVSRDSFNSSGTMTQRAYARQDANWNVTSIVVSTNGTTWTTGERYIYSPYGVQTVLNASWGGPASYGGPANGSSYDWSQGFQGEFYDVVSGLILMDTRVYGPSTGTMKQPDPGGYAASGADLYEYVNSDPTAFADPSGMTGTPTEYPGGSSTFHEGGGPTSRPTSHPNGNKTVNGGSATTQNAPCGPDVTDWFNKEIELFKHEVKHLLDGQDPWLADNDPLIPIQWQAEKLKLLHDLGLSADYKSRDFGTGAGNVSICGMCVGSNQLGNLMFGIVAGLLGLTEDARSYGRGDSIIGKLGGATGPSQNWKDAPWKESAFDAGVAIAGGMSLCDALHKAKDLSHGCGNAAPSKEPYNGPHTDFSKPSLVDPSGNKMPSR